MSLQGSLDTFQLPDVLVLLSSTKKTGELRVVGGSVSGKLWLADGQLVQGAAGRATDIVDAVWELLRLPSGTFSFDADGKPPKGGSPQMVDLVLADAQARLAEWREIEAVVPSLAHWVALTGELADDEVVVDRRQWKIVVSVGDGRSVAELMERLGGGEFDTCKQLKGLVEAGLVAVGEPRGERAAPAASQPAAAPEPVPAAPEPVPAEPVAVEPEPVAEAEAVEEEPHLRPARGSRKKATATAEAAESASDPAPDEVPAPPTPDEAVALVAQLAALGDDEAAELAPVGAALAEGEGEVPMVGEDGEPINRGLLLKFLSSVRS